MSDLTSSDRKALLRLAGRKTLSPFAEAYF